MTPMRKLIQTEQEVANLKTGRRSRIALLARAQDTYEPTTDQTGVIRDASGNIRFATDELIQIDTHLTSERVFTPQVLTLRLTGIDPITRYVFDMRRGHAYSYGYDDLCQLWETWVNRYDATAGRFWRNCQPLVEQDKQEKLFRKFLRTRNPVLYCHWTLMVVPVVSEILPEAGGTDTAVVGEEA